MNITYQSALDYGIEPTAALLTEGFSGYFVPIQIPPAGLMMMVRQDSVDLNLSRIILNDNQPVGAAMIARRGWTSRLAAMSIIPDARGKGVGDVAVRQLLGEAKERGDQAMTLEVIEENTPGVRLYTKCGFRNIRRLVGFVGQPQISDSVTELRETDILGVARALIAYGSTDLPWQISGESLGQSGPPNVGYRNVASYIALSNPHAPTIYIRAIVTQPAARRKGSATFLLRAVMARYPDKQWRVSATFPEELGGLYEKIGMEREKLSQWQMMVEL